MTHRWPQPGQSDGCAQLGWLRKADGGLRFTEIVIHPQIQVQTEEHRASAERVMEKAKQGWLIANSLRTTVRVEPAFEVVQPAA